jgi:carbon starvation protein
MFVGNEVPLSLPDSVFGLGPAGIWVVILFTYAAIASLLPVWLLLQPRDYINGLQLFIGLGIFFLAVLIARPEVVAPMINSSVPDDVPPIFPLLFVTIACGACSGFHGLVSSGTTSKQINNEQDVRFVGFLGTVGEGSLALAAIIACTAGFATLGDWQGYYTSFATNGIDAFVQGGGVILASIPGISESFGRTLLAVMAILFAATTMDTGVRLQRYIVQEWGTIYDIPALTGKGLSTVLAVGCCLALAFGSGGGGEGGLIIWPLFGTTNQLLAALTLLVLSVFILKQGRPTLYTLAPFSFLLFMTIWALLTQLRGFYESEQYFLLGLDAVILVTAIWVGLESLSALRKAASGSRESSA